MCIFRELHGASAERLRNESMTFTTQLNHKIEIMTVSSNHHLEGKKFVSISNWISWNFSILVNPCDAEIYDRIVISDIIKQIAQTNVIDPSGQREFRVIVLSDEDDELTKDAQHSLRRTMEKYVATCRHILCVNSTSRVIPAIKSRFLGIGVAAPSHDEIINVLNVRIRIVNCQSTCN
jgi:replication factor C subunit 3/5